MIKKFSRVLSIILLIAMCFSLFSTVTFAEDTPEENEEQIILSVDEVEEEPQPIEETEIVVKQELVPEPEPEQVEMSLMMAPAPMVEPEIELDSAPVIEEKEEVASEPIIEEKVETPIVIEKKTETPILKAVEPEPEPDPEPEIVYPFIVTYHFHFRGANAEWRETSSSQKVTSEGFNNSKAVSFFSKQITNNKLQTVKSDTVTYTWLGTWTGELGTLTDSDRVYTNTTLFQTDTDIHFYADYSEVSIAHLTANYIDNVAHGCSSWHDVGDFGGYTHTFKEPADIPEHYTFLYWDLNGTQYKAGAERTINSSELSGDTELNYIASYSYQAPIQLTYHYKDGEETITSYEPVNIYDKAPITSEWTYDNKTVIPKDEVIALPDSVVVTELTENFKEVHVYAKLYNVSWVNDDDTLLATSSNLAYGETPVYEGETPTKPATAQYTYKFNSWTPTVVPATADATYKATYDSTINNYTVTFKNYDDTVLSSTVYPYGTKVGDIAQPVATRPNTAQYTYKFVGWDKMIVDVTEDATYTAMYDATINKYIITFLNYDGKVLSQRTYNYGTKAADIAVPVATRENTRQYTFEFAGWDKPIADVTENAVYVANYNSDLNKYTVIWVNEDNTILEIDRNVNYGVVPTYNSKTPTKAATAQYSYTFAGWAPNVVAVTGNAVYTAYYNENINSYLVTFNPGSHGTFAPQMTYVPYGGATPAAPNPTGEEGWEFTGWDFPIGGIVYGNVTFTAQWQKVTPAPSPVLPEDDDGIRTIEDIEDGNTPLAAPQGATWALVNLILLVFTIFTLLKFDEEHKYNIFTYVGVLGALLLFILTENVYNKMIIVDRWTLCQLVFYAVGLLSRVLYKKKEEEENPIEENSMNDET